MNNGSILMADDDADDRFLVQAAFEDNRLVNTIVFFEDGEQLLEYYITENPNIPHLIFLDLNMPKRDGREVLKVIRKSDKWDNVPIIIFSTSNAPDDILASYQLGANCYLVKPSSYEELKDLILSVHKFWLRRL
ncbi:response regulator [Dyadobacter sp. CY345]|uniref:response regulator n=1 Tax=Dyadobacter sp. CY345 TaxID=2909335 RepID=UPI001F24D87A|nr:response regulator [Dyadobacter sp. CY345]MCF2444607.1 response regulator [Dyadobacter sp. CY345]